MGREAGPAFAGQSRRFAALQGILSRVLASGTNAVIVGYPYAFFASAGRPVAAARVIPMPARMGDAAVFGMASCVQSA
jgi:hypothetical protein